MDSKLNNLLNATPIGEKITAKRVLKGGGCVPNRKILKIACGWAKITSNQSKSKQPTTYRFKCHVFYIREFKSLAVVPENFDKKEIGDIYSDEGFLNDIQNLLKFAKNYKKELVYLTRYSGRKYVYLNAGNGLVEAIRSFFKNLNTYHPDAMSNYEKKEMGIKKALLSTGVVIYGRYSQNFYDKNDKKFTKRLGYKKVKQALEKGGWIEKKKEIDEYHKYYFFEKKTTDKVYKVKVYRYKTDPKVSCVSIKI